MLVRGNSTFDDFTIENFDPFISSEEDDIHLWIDEAEASLEEK